MRDVQVGRVIRALRHRRGWTQRELGARAGVSDSVICEIELGRLDQQKWGVVRRVVEALGASVEALPRWRGGELDRLLDADHAALTEGWSSELVRRGWDVKSEVSFNNFGERGRIDLLAYHRVTRTLLVDEHKTVVADMQQLLGGLDVKVRLAPHAARRFGWDPARTVPCVVFAEGRTNRRRVEQLPMLFSRFELRGRSAMAWIDEPNKLVGGLLVYRALPNSATGGVRRAGRQRIRLRRPCSSVTESPLVTPEPHSRA